MRFGGVLPGVGAATTAPTQHTSSDVAVERLICEIGAALEQRGAESGALRMLRECIRAREVNAIQGVLTPLETGLMSELVLINRAHADPEVREA